MTREEAKKSIYDDSTNNEIHLLRLHKHIDKIYDDFESRTCENCKHRKEMIYCNVLWTDVGEVEHLWVDKDFGCNKFERKEDD